MLDEILVIRDSIPIFYYNRDPAIALSTDFYVLQSGFFVALTQFANEMTHEKIKYVVLENRIYALDEVSNVLIIFGDKSKLSLDIIEKLKNDLYKATQHVTYLFEKYGTDSSTGYIELNTIANEFGVYLKQENLVEDDAPFNAKESRSLMQKFIFTSIGYKPGQCNIGPIERQKRLLTGIIAFAIAIVGAFAFFFVPTINPLFSFLLAIPFFMGFFGLFQ